MITLSVSQSYAYDMLAIAHIKMTRNSSTAAVLEHMRLVEQIQPQVGAAKHDAIVRSPEYARLQEVNDQMYLRIDEMKQRAPTGEDAQYIDDRVYARFKAKQALQWRWFPGENLTETKHGYTGEEDKRV